MYVCTYFQNQSINAPLMVTTVSGTGTIRGQDHSTCHQAPHYHSMHIIMTTPSAATMMAREAEGAGMPPAALIVVPRYGMLQLPSVNGPAKAPVAGVGGRSWVRHAAEV